MAEYSFEGYDLERMATLIDADHARVPTWRKQAAAYRKLAELADLHHSKITGHIQQAMDVWSSRSTSVVRHGADDIAESFQRGRISASGNAKALDAIADEIEAAKARMDEIRTEWAELKAAYEKDPTIFKKGVIEGVTTLEEAKAAFDQAGRERMHAMSVETTQAWYTNMHAPGPYTGPTYGNEPRVPLRPSTGSGSGGGPDTTYPFTYHPPPPSGMTPGTGPTGSEIAPPSGATPHPPANDPSLEFPTSPVHSPGPAVISPTAPTPTAPGPLPTGGFPPSAPPVSPGLFNGMRPPGGMPPTVPGQRPGMAPSAGGPRTSPPVLGQRAGTTGQPTTAGRPGTASPDKGVIRNPKQANGSTTPPAQRSNRRAEDREDVFRDGPETDELFEGLSLDSVPDVVRPEPEAPRVRRRDVGPVLRRRF